jgi:hypothetical protein
MIFSLTAESCSVLAKLMRGNDQSGTMGALRWTARMGPESHFAELDSVVKIRVSEQIGRSIRTVEFQLNVIYRKLAMTGRTQLVWGLA